LLGAIMPLTWPLYVDGKLNPQAVALFAAALRRRLVI
jgi:hypothetical protein